MGNCSDRAIKADFGERRGQLHDGVYCKLVPCDKPAPIKPLRCLITPRSK